MPRTHTHARRRQKRHEAKLRVVQDRKARRTELRRKGRKVAMQA